ncbi:hypothetical protein Elgi_36790 [Paenibacillus elgii]|uniref:hypothetical protein n=1 Tax=Paenibacillus elgii TaxID=189691 RepID=UPI000248CFD8|nr:hypothetical protein [Paenibacillus elgii]GMX64410.1 hypothetical protein Elgi_36790 [Paenibacillus elgii]
MIIYKTLSRWDADMEFKNMAEYQAFREWETAKIRIDGIESELKKEYKRLTLPSYAEYIEETKEIIHNLENELKEMKVKKEESERKMDEAKEQPEEYGKL